MDGPCQGNKYVVPKDLPARQVIKSGLNHQGVSVWFQCIYRPGPNVKEWYLESVREAPADFNHQLSRRYDK